MLAVQRVVGWCRVAVAPGFLTAAAETAEYGSCCQEAEGSHPAQVESLTKLPFLCNVDCGIVEVLDDGIGNPADWNERDGTREDEEEPSRQENIALGRPAALPAPRALHPNSSNQERQGGER